jgi:hypothetical protein
MFLKLLLFRMYKREYVKTNHIVDYHRHNLNKLQITQPFVVRLAMSLNWLYFMMKYLY